MRVNLWIPDILLRKLDSNLKGRSRSSFVSQLIEDNLGVPKKKDVKEIKVPKKYL